LSRHFTPGVPEYRRATIIAALSTKLQSARSPQEVNAIFTILTLAGQDAFPAVVRSNQDAFSAIDGAIIADHLAHLQFGDMLRRAGILSTSTELDIANAFNRSAAGRFLMNFAYLPDDPSDQPKTASGMTDEAVKAARTAHDTLVVQLAILSASRDAIVTLLPKLDNPGIALDRCFIPETKLVGNRNLKNLSIRYSFIASTDLRGLGFTDILIQDLVKPPMAGCRTRA
jgi:hypothetical protein